MKRIVLFIGLFAFVFAAVAEAQLRDDLTGKGDFTGAVIKSDHSTNSSLGNWLESLNVSMGHSYSMNFGNFGGEFQNINAYTNHLLFDLSENMTGYLDVSILHSPFGSSFMNMGNNDLGARVIIDRAQLDYQISPNTSLSIQFSQQPYYSPFGRGFRPGSFGARSFHGY